MIQSSSDSSSASESWGNIERLAKYHPKEPLSIQHRVITRNESGRLFMVMRDGSSTELNLEEIREIADRIRVDIEEGVSRLPRRVAAVKHTQNMITQALQNYRLLGFAKIAPLNEHLVASQFKSAHFEEMAFFAKFESDLLPEIEEINAALKTANDPEVASRIRASFTPQMTGANTANGTYYLFTPALSTSQPFSDLTKVKKAFICKPTLQEAGNLGNPKCVSQARDGIIGGEGAIRERLVYVGQKLLGVDLGIPPTIIKSGKNSFFTLEINPAEINHLLENIKKIDSTMTLETFLSLMSNGETIDTIEALIINKALQKKGEGEFQIKLQEIIKNLKASCKPITLPSLKRELKNWFNMATINENVGLIKEALEQLEGLKNLRMDIEQLWSILLTPAKEEAILSMQRYVPDCRSLGGTTPDFQSSLSIEEVHKFVIDLIFFNTDRHLSNVLVDYSNPKGPSLVLIDHGSCLPNPMVNQGCKALLQARFEFLTLPQTEYPLHPKFADAIRSLDIEHYIALLKSDQSSHQVQFGELCAIPEDCYNLIRLNLHLVKIGVEMGATLKQMATFQHVLKLGEDRVGGEIVDFFDKYISKTDPVNWDIIDQEIRKLLAIPLLARTGLFIK